jgi:acetyl-CoA carboxylase biotin carboxylase subunit
MFEKILVANRGEIAVRVIRACKELNIRSVAVYSEADAKSMAVELADEAICIGKAPANESYLRIDRLISAAEISDADAIHPGYGFLAENSHFADVCENCNIRFIGPSAQALNLLDNKTASRALAKKVGLLVPPGSDGLVEQERDAITLAKRIGYPVMIKAVAGGGGRAMRMANDDITLVAGYHTTRTEAEKAFGNSGVYIEKYIENARHIEIQILGDSKGGYLHLGERDCSIQRRNQKILEESPSPFLNAKLKDLRKKMGKAAVRLAEAARFSNAGTVEFLVDDKGNYFFLEVNKQIQPGHPITEEITGLDLVKLQIMTAMGEPLPLSQSDVPFNGHSICFHINAEDPFDDFRPSPGRIEMYYPPGGRGVRLDTHIHSGYLVPPHYDSLLGKVIVHGQNRRESIDLMTRALDEFTLTGIKTTISFGQAILQDPDFRRGVYSTAFLDKLLSGARRENLEENA